jgi:hypothetical protein
MVLRPEENSSRRQFQRQRLNLTKLVSRSACIAAGVPSAIKMRSMKCPHRIFRRNYLVMEGTGKIGG